MNCGMKPCFVVFGAIMLAAGLTACGTTTRSATTSGVVTKGAGVGSAFCGFDKAIDKALAAATPQSYAAYAVVLKSSGRDVAGLSATAPAGALGAEAKALAASAQAAASSGDGSLLYTSAADKEAGDVDTYCGVDGVGNPLPTDFAKGVGSVACASFKVVNDAMNSATSQSGVLAAIAANKSSLDAFSSKISTFPANLRGEAYVWVDVLNGASSASCLCAAVTPQQDIALYCGMNH